MHKLWTLFVPFTLSFIGCGGAAVVAPPPADVPTEAGDKTTSLPAVGPTDGVACVGTIDALPDGAKEVTDEPFAQAAIDATGKGKLCMARVFEALKPLKVYRVWNSQKTYTEFGSWWSFAKPVGPVETYREQNAICPEWSDLDRVTVCEIKVGARFAVGPGQSAACETAKYEKSAVNQVFIPNDTRENRVFVEHCEQLGAFP
ncbi:MAG: hypothetical protein IPM54_07490 [Polyangiaceae bacterium]|nr:hypothetical protein [Polyangiaceae bacterium]